MVVGDIQGITGRRRVEQLLAIDPLTIAVDIEVNALGGHVVACLGLGVVIGADDLLPFVDDVMFYRD